MTKICIEHMVDFLVRRKFPESLDDTDLITNSPWHIGPILVEEYSGPSHPERYEQENMLKMKSFSYQSELLALQPSKLNALYEKEVKKNSQEIETKGQAIDQSLYDHSKSEADIGYWSKLPSWKLDEAVALSFGKSPEIVNWSSVQENVQISPFARKYSQRRDIVLRGEQLAELSNPVGPNDFLLWAEHYEIECPQKLVELVKKREPNLEDWKTKYEKLNAEFSDLKKERDQLREEVTKWKKSENTKVKNSLYKMILGMAKGAYTYQPGKRSSIVKEIVDDLLRNGIEIHEDTVRSRLNEASVEIS